jgi:hypothetical protein
VNADRDRHVKVLSSLFCNSPQFEEMPRHETNRQVLSVQNLKAMH